MFAQRTIYRVSSDQLAGNPIDFVAKLMIIFTFCSILFFPGMLVAIVSSNSYNERRPIHHHRLFSVKDIFSKQADLYARFRPTYPQELFDFILSLVTKRINAWDCATGNGQVASVLSKFFEHIDATDISEKQIKNATQIKNIAYAIERAEQTSFPDNKFDLITVAQAIHWLEFTGFYREVTRTLKPNGIFAVIGYHTPLVNSSINPIINRLESEILHTYWDEETKYVDEFYTTIPFPFTELQVPKFNAVHHWTMEQLLGFLSSWSGVQHYIERNNENPVQFIAGEMKKYWNDRGQKEVTFPILLRVGKKA